MTSKEAIKRLRQETTPNTYMPDFDKEECLKVIETDLEILEILSKNKLLDLGLLYDYDISEYEDYYDDTAKTTNELSYDEFVKLKEWQDNEIHKN